MGTPGSFVILTEKGKGDRDYVIHTSKCGDNHLTGLQNCTGCQHFAILIG